MPYFIVHVPLRSFPIYFQESGLLLINHEAEMDNIQMKTKLESHFPFFLDSKPRSASKLRSPPRNVAAFLATTSRLPVYYQDQLKKGKVLGSGRSFQTQVCEDIKSGHLVVVKQSRMNQSSGELHDSAVLQELKVSVYPPFLNHQNIVRTLGILESDNPMKNGLYVSLVLEYADGGSLAECFSSHRPTSQQDWLQKQYLIMDICSGLEILHRCRVIHGDVKPENILLFSAPSSTGRSMVAKLADFGSSIVEDTINEDIDAGILTPIYRGTPVYVPGYVRSYSGRVPFHFMPAIEIYSFGLLIWSICRGEPYYLHLSKTERPDWISYLDSLGTDKFLQRFRSDLEELFDSSEYVDPFPSYLLDAFNFCVAETEIDHSPILPFDRETVYREAFSRITHVRSILSSWTRESSSSKDEVQTSSWQPFHLGSNTLKANDNGDKTPWHLQCELVQQLLDELNDPQESNYQRGKAALRLTSHFAVGFGCRKDYERVLYYIRLSATLGDHVAQFICPRVFQAHGKLYDRFDLEDIPHADSDPESGTFDDSDVGMEDIDEDGENDENEGYDDEAAASPISIDSMHDADSLRSTASSGRDLQYAIFFLSAQFDGDFYRTPDREPTDYFWMKMRLVERAFGFGSQTVPLLYRSKCYNGIEDPTLAADLQSTAVSTSKVPEVSLRCEDGGLIQSSALHRAVYCGMFKLAKQLVDKGWPINAVNDDGDTLLHIAMRHGYSEMTEFLITKGADVTVTNGKGVTPLHYLFMFGKQNQDLEVTDDGLGTQADTLSEGHVLGFTGPDIRAIGKMLVDAGADVNASMGEFDSTVDVVFSHRMSGTPLHAAVTAGNKLAVQTLLWLGANVNIQHYDNSDTVLEVAAQLHLAHIAQILLDHGAILRSTSDSGASDGSWAMHYVVSHVEPLTRWLLHGSCYKTAVQDTIRVFMAAARRESLSLDSRDQQGLTAFDYALQESGEDTYIVEAFLDCYATLPSDALSSAVLSCESDEANSSKVELVLQRRHASGTPSADEKDKNPSDKVFSALRLAASTGALAAAKTIIEYFGSDSLLHTQDEEGMTPLHEAVVSGNMNMTSYLLSKNAPINYRSVNGRTALGVAVTLGNEELVLALLIAEANLKLDAGEHEGGTILHLAASPNSRRSHSMLGFLLSADLDESNGDALRFPQLHAQSILDAVDITQGRTALHIAAYCGDYGGVFALVAAGAAVSIRNKTGSTPLNIVKQRIEQLDPVKQDPAHLGLVASLGKCARCLQRARPEAG